MNTPLIRCNLVSLFLFVVFNLQAQVTINEWMADNVASLADEAGEYDDWFELYNSGDVPIDLQGYYLSDDSAEPEKFQIQQSLILAAGAFTIFWADDDLSQGDQHVNFKLGSSGEEILLSSPVLELIDAVVFGNQTSDVSTGAYPDGNNEYFTTSAYTPGSANMNGDPAGIEKPIFQLSAGFYDQQQSLLLSHPNAADIYYTLNG